MNEPMDRLLSNIEICHLLNDDEAYDHAGDISIAYFCKAQDVKSTAARDKWWVERIEKFIGTCLSLEVDSEHCLICDKAGVCHIESWQQLKKELGL
jgi:hypothetical protein